MSSALFWPVVLQIIAVLVIIAEFILPSAGLLTLAALGLIGYSLFLVFTTVSTGVGFVFVVFDILMIPVMVVVGIKVLAASPVTLRTSLKREDGAASQPREWTALVGAEGVALTDLRPSGNARIGGKRYDVMSGGEYIERGAVLTVTGVDGNRIMVKIRKADTGDEAAARDQSSPA